MRRPEVETHKSMGPKQKVFGIGFHKTGTKSLAAALRSLGYRVAGPVGARDPDIAETALRHAMEAVRNHDAFQDNPFPILFREMDRACSGSKFILTRCGPDEWLERVVRYFGTQETPMRQWIYGAGSPLGHEAAYRERFEKHNRDVVDYFRDRPADLLVFDLTASPDWRPICDFLGHEIPNCPFPHVNKGRRNGQLQ